MSQARKRSSIKFSVAGALGGVLLLSSGCVAPPVMTTKAEKFPLMYAEKPVSILVLPPINATTAADAKDYYATTIAAPLALCGFYVIPMEVSSELLKAQGIYDTETILRQPVAKFGQYFGADAVLYTEINKWDTMYAVIAANLTVSVHAYLKSTHTENILWEYSGTVVVDLTGRSSSGNPLADLIAGAIATSIATAAADYVPYAIQTNAQILQTIPDGKYHPEFLKDRDFKFVDQKPGKNLAGSGGAPSLPKADIR